MLPSVVASELEQVAADAIRTAFHPTTPGFRGLIDRFLADRERLLKGPYVSVSLLSRVNPLGRFATIKLAGEGPQVVAGDNLGAATRKVSHPATRILISTEFS